MSVSTFVLLLVTGLSLAGLYFLIASGLSLIFGLMDVLNLAHGLFFTVGGYIAFFAMQVESLPLTARFVLAGVGAALGGYLLGHGMERLFIHRFYGNHITQILITLGLSMAGVALLGAWFTYDNRTAPLPEWLNSVTTVAGARIAMSRWVIIAVSLAMLVGLLSFLGRTRHGLVIRAGVENRDMVTMLGIDVRRSFTLVFAIGGAMAGVGGWLGSVYFNGVNPSNGIAILIFAFVVVVIGGLGSVTGTAVAAVLVGLTQQFVNYLAAPGVGDLTVMVLLAATLLVRPQGLLGRVSR